MSTQEKVGDIVECRPSNDPCWGADRKYLSWRGNTLNTFEGSLKILKVGSENHNQDWVVLENEMRMPGMCMPIACIAPWTEPEAGKDNPKPVSLPCLSGSGSLAWPSVKPGIKLDALPPDMHTSNDKAGEKAKPKRVWSVVRYEDGTVSFQSKTGKFKINTWGGGEIADELNRLERKIRRLEGR